MPVIPATGRMRQENGHKCEASQCRPHSKKRETQREKEYRGTQRETQRGIERERRQRQRDRARRDREKTEERERENINVYPSLCPPPSISVRQGLTYPRMDSEAL